MSSFSAKHRRHGAQPGNTNALTSLSRLTLTENILRQSSTGLQVLFNHCLPVMLEDLPSASSLFDGSSLAGK